MTVRVRNEPQHFAVPHAGDVGTGAPCAPCELIAVYGTGDFRPVLTALAQAVAEGRAVDLPAADAILGLSETDSLSLEEYAAMPVIVGLHRLASLRPFPARSSRDWERRL